jgi:hypothetical protein
LDYNPEPDLDKITARGLLITPRTRPTRLNWALSIAR